MASKIISNETKEKIIEFYLSKPMSLQTVAEAFNFCIPTVMKILKDIPKYDKTHIYSPNINETYFETIDSDDKAYFLGLLIADGNVFQSKSNRKPSISLTLNLEDEYMLQTLQDKLGLNHTIAHDGRGCGQISIRSKIMADNLAIYGVVPRKSFNTYLPKIDTQFLPGLIRGILDGDGHIQCHYNIKTQKHLHNISFCGSHTLMQNISDLLYTTLHLTTCPKVYDYKNKKLSEIKIQNIQDIITVGNWLYNNTNLYLVRKFSKFTQLIEYYTMYMKTPR